MAHNRIYLTCKICNESFLLGRTQNYYQRWEVYDRTILIAHLPNKEALEAFVVNPLYNVEPSEEPFVTALQKFFDNHQHDKADATHYKITYDQLRNHT